MNGTINAGDIANATGRDGARQEIMYPKPTTTCNGSNICVCVCV